jgi:hypothetical protein
MGLFKSGKSKADDLLSILIPSLQWQMQEELKKRLVAQMEDVVREAANQVISYGYNEAIKELTVQVRAPKRGWIGLTDEEISEVLGSDIYQEQSGELKFIRAIEDKLKEKNK